MKQNLKYLIPIVIVFGIVLAILNFKGVINSEIPVDYNPDPYPLHQNECPVEPDTGEIDEDEPPLNDAVET